MAIKAFNMHSRCFQVFAISKQLVPRIMSRIVEAVGEELCRLMQCVSSFSRNGALQVRPWYYFLVTDSNLWLMRKYRRKCSGSGNTEANTFGLL